MVLICFWLILPPPSFANSSGAQYVKCRAQRCTEGNRQYLFPGHVDTNSLVVQDEYVFTQVCWAAYCVYFLLIKLAMSSSSFHSSAPPTPALHSLPFVHLLRVSSLNQISRNGFLRAHLFPHWPVVCFDYVLSRSHQGSLSLFAWQHAWQMCVSGWGARTKRSCE